MSVTALICAAGKGERAGFEKNKLLVPFCGSTILEKTVAAFDLPEIDEILLAVSPDDKQEIESLFNGNPKIKTVLGGNSRFQSVKNALTYVTGEIVLVHDGARPFVTRTVIEGCIESVQKYGSGICAISSTDTVAVCKDGKIESVPDRTTLAMIQTPQGFTAQDLKKAYALAENADGVYTDDSSVYAKFIAPPVLCEGSTENVKLTHPEDFRKRFARVGFGVDTHAFGKPQNHIVLCGTQIPSDSGLIAHSDGDVAVHAVMDALLSAAGKKDIGHYFPDTDERYKNVSSMRLLAQVVEMLRADGYAAQNVAVAIQAEKPKLKNYIDGMQQKLAETLGVDVTAVGITAGTNEKLGYVGEGKGITVYAQALLQTL